MANGKVIATGQQFMAKYFGKCAQCGTTIRKGGLIVMASFEGQAKRAAIHWDCAPEHAAATAILDGYRRRRGGRLDRRHVGTRSYYDLDNGNGVADLTFDPLEDVNALRGWEEHKAHEDGASYDDNAERYAGEFGTCGRCGARTIDAGGHCEPYEDDNDELGLAEFDRVQSN